jgi:ribonucleoside-diphosphate reductase alpha chain
MYPKKEEQFVTTETEIIWDDVVSVEELDDQDVYDLNVPKHHNFVCEGFVVKNCSEVVLPNNLSCNLMSINNLKFLKNKGEYDIESYKHAIQLCQIVLDTVNTMAHLPTREVALNTYKYRPTGLGMANLGTLLMEMGLQYGSNEARWTAARLMSIMTAQSYVTSAKMAQELGPFPGWSENSNGMLRVIRNHRRAAYGVKDGGDVKTKKDLGDYECLVVKPYIADGLFVALMEKESRSLWDIALSLGGSYGFRNAATSALAPTGTISFIMGCETTGIEPCYALVTYKTLSGGGTMKLVVPSVEKSLRNMGYNTDDIKRAAEHIEKNGTLHNCDFIRPDHRDVFKCAASSVKDDVINWEDHVLMTAVLQPFVSGGISKTINMPENATEEDIIKAHELAYMTGCKGISVYRDGCKGAAPLSVKQTKTETKTEKPTEETIIKEINSRISDHKFIDSVEAVLQRRFHSPGEWGLRKHPKELMHGFRHKISIGGTRGYIETFLYEDSRIAEIFMTFGNPGSSLSNVMECWAIAFSVSLQRGEPLGKLCQKFIGVEFEPKGFTGRRDDLKKVSSPIDYVARLLLKLFDENGVLRKDAFAHEHPKHEKKEEKIEASLAAPVNLASRPHCPQCGALMTGGSDKCPSCEKCGFFGGCGG